MQDKMKQLVMAHVTRDGACGYGIGEVMKAKGVHDLISLMLTPKGIEHCVKYQWPTFEMMLPYKDELERNGVYLTGSHGIVNPRLVVAFGGEVNITVDGYNVCEIYATNDAIIDVSASGNSFVSVELHHGSKLYSKVLDDAKLKEFKH